jgi:hypothetical protein
MGCIKAETKHSAISCAYRWSAGVDSIPHGASGTRHLPLIRIMANSDLICFDGSNLWLRC